MADELKHIIQLIDDMRDNRVIEAAIRAHVQAAIDAALESAEQAVLDKGRVSIAADLPSSSGYCTSADIIRSRIGTNPLADLQQKNLELDRHNMELRDRVAELEEEITSFRRPTEVNGELVQNVPPHVLADLSRKDAKIAELERERDEVRKDVESHKAML